MSPELKFGTDGWRSRIDADFNDRNVMRVAAGILQYIKKTKGREKGVFIGYDGRSSSRRFAECCAAVISSGGIECFMPPRPMPTPISAYAAVKYSLNGSIMITASHNPPEYNGIKFIPDYGGPATPEITDAIEKLIPKRLDPKNLKSPGMRSGLISEMDPLPDYLAHLDRLFDLKGNSLKVYVDPMHGATAGIIDAILRHFEVDAKSIRGNLDPNFGGTIPDPTPANLAALRQNVLDTRSDLGVALDGDGDRLSVVTDEGNFLMVNQILPIVYLHLNDIKSLKGDAARTVATSHLIDAICSSRGYRAIEVPVGFKYIGSLLRSKEVSVGGEESGGMSFANHIPEKDGIASTLMVLEHLHATGDPISVAMHKITDEFGSLISSRVDLRTHSIQPNLMSVLESAISSKLAGAITHVNRMDGLKITFNDGAWVLFRKSGTENVVRVYAESSSKERTDSLLALGKSLL